MSNRFSKVKDISSIGITDVIGSAIAALFWFYLATLIGPETYGEINYMLSIAAIASNVSLLGATQSLLVYSAKNVRIHATFYLINLIIGIISAIIVAFIVQDFTVGLLVIGYLVFALAYTDVLGKRYFKAYTKYTLIQKVLMISLSLGLFLLIGKEGIILGMAISLFLGIIKIIHGFQETKIDFKLFKEKSNFILFNYAHTLTSALHGSIDKIVIGPMFGFLILGSYSLGMQFFSLLMILPIIVGKYLIPQESSGIENKKLKNSIILISIIIGVTGAFIGPEISSIVFPKFSEADSVIRIISLAVIPQTIIITTKSKLLSNEKGRHVLTIGIIRTALIVISIISLGQLYGIEGIAVGVVLSSIGGAVYSVLTARNLGVEKNIQ